MKDRTNIIIFVIVLSVLYSPTWLVGILGIIFGNGGMIAFAIAYATFWLAPFTPFWTIVIALTFSIRKIVDKIQKNKGSTKYYNDENVRK